MNKNCHNSRTSNDISKKHGPVTKVDKRKTKTSKKRRIDKLWRHCNFSN